MTAVATITACATGPHIDRDRSIAENAEALLVRYNVPAVAWTLVDGSQTIETGAVGTSRAGAGKRVTEDSRFHIGSNTKAMTALLAGIAVERGEIFWNSTIGEILPKGGYDVPAAYSSITLRLLLSHSAGVPTLMAPNQWHAHFTSGKPGPVQRREMVKEVFELPLDFPPGTSTAYSNMGIVIAGAMLEVAGGTDWETLMQTRIFNPLGMTSAGFGPPAAGGSTEEPWGHRDGPVDPTSPGADNPAGLGPAGTVHTSIKDLAKYLSALVSEGDPLISQETFEVITTEVQAGYALGWLVVPGQDPAIFAHDGSNGMFYSTILIIPETNRAVAVVANAGHARPMVEALAGYLLLENF